LTDDACAVGVDVGGTKIAGAVVSFPSGEVHGRTIIATEPQRGGEAVLDDVAALVDRLRHRGAELEVPLVGVGVGVAELVSLDQRIESDLLIRWRGLPVVERLGGPDEVILEADIRAAALAEAHLGAGRQATSFAYLAIGTGIGFVLVQDGVPWRGARGSAGTFGYSPIRHHSDSSPEPLDLLVEPLASGPALVARFRRRGGLAERAEDVIAAAEAGDNVAAAVVREGAEVIGSSVGFAVDLLDPQLIVIGGGLGLAAGLYRDTLERAMRRSIWSNTNRGLPILDAELGTDAALVGAAYGAWVRAVGAKPS
jgi:glucokinase